MESELSRLVILDRREAINSGLIATILLWVFNAVDATFRDPTVMVSHLVSALLQTAAAILRLGCKDNG
jgi:hypothetical protein